VLAAAGALVWLWLLQGGVSLWSCVVAGLDSKSIGVAVALTVSSTGAPVVIGWAWVGDTDTVTWEAGVHSVSIGIDEASFCHLVAGVWQEGAGHLQKVGKSSHPSWKS